MCVYATCCAELKVCPDVKKESALPPAVSDSNLFSHFKSICLVCENKLSVCAQSCNRGTNKVATQHLSSQSALGEQGADQPVHPLPDFCQVLYLFMSRLRTTKAAP